MSAINFVHLMDFCTKGSHGKPYYPWMFPKHFPRCQEVAAEPYRILAQFWTVVYYGYCVKRVSQFLEFKAQSGLSQPDHLRFRARKSFEEFLSLVSLQRALPGQLGSKCDASYGTLVTASPYTTPSCVRRDG